MLSFFFGCIVETRYLVSLYGIRLRNIVTEKRYRSGQSTTVTVPTRSRESRLDRRVIVYKIVPKTRYAFANALGTRVVLASCPKPENERLKTRLSLTRDDYRRSRDPNGHPTTFSR